MLRDALQEWNMGNPDRQSTDVGLVIDAEARAQIEAHIERMQAAGRKSRACNAATARRAQRPLRRPGHHRDRQPGA